jgi:hypothetical protein
VKLLLNAGARTDIKNQEVTPLLCSS